MTFSEKRLHIVPFLMYPIIAAIVSFWLELNFLWSIILFFGIPAIHLSILIPKSIYKSALFSIIAATPLVLVIDHIAHITNVWYVPSVFPFRIFGQVPVEDVIWGVFLGYVVVMFYEYFFDTHNDKRLWRPRMKIFLSALLGIFIIFLIFLFLAPRLLHIPFFYIWFGTIVFLLPVLVEFYRRPRLIKKFLLTAVYFFFLSFVYEVTALKVGWWEFPGDEVLGWVTVFGVSFPIEELFFWFVIAAMTILSYYEFFDDDEK